MRRFFCAALIVAGLFVATPAHAAPLISFSSATFQVGNSFNVDVWLTGNSERVSSFAFDFLFNSSVLHLDNILEGSIFGGNGSFNTSGGSVKSVDGSIFPNEVNTPSPSKLATLRFTAVGAGAAGLQLLNTELKGTNWFFIIPYEYDIDHGTTNGNLSVTGGTNPTPVPEPGTITLFGMGAYALARRLRRRNATEVAVS
jgi:hypothetical protein